MSPLLIRCLLFSALVLAPPRLVAGAELEDPYFGEALYYAYQGDYFRALERLEVGNEDAEATPGFLRLKRSSLAKNKAKGRDGD